MKDSPSDNPKKSKQQPSRRGLIAGGTALAASLVGVGVSRSDLIRDALNTIGPDADKAALEKEFHAAEVYMNYQEGRLRRNFERLRALSHIMQAGKYDGLPDYQRSTAIDKDIAQILAERDVILSELDRGLIHTYLDTA